MNETAPAIRIETVGQDTVARDVKIDIRDLNFYYGKAPALKSVSFGVPSNAVTSIIGPSGCGKSTLLRTINRIFELYPEQRATGEIIIDGANVLDRGYSLSGLRRLVGMVFQKPTPFASSIRSNVGFALNYYDRLSKSELNDRIEDALRQAALWDEVKDKLNQSALGLSGGQQQRLCIARALAVNPEVILMDEPCSALDPIATGRIEDLMEEIKQDYTIIIVTHNMQQAARVSDRCAFFTTEVNSESDLRTGTLVEFDATEKMFSNPSDERTENHVTGRFG